MRCARCRYVATVGALLKAGADPGLVDGDGDSPVTLASARGMLAIKRLFQERQAEETLGAGAGHDLRALREDLLRTCTNAQLVDVLEEMHAHKENLENMTLSQRWELITSLPSMRDDQLPPLLERLNGLNGRRVRIGGLTARPDLNGRRGVAIAYDAPSGRYAVQLEDGAHEGKAAGVKVRAANLELVE